MKKNKVLLTLILLFVVGFLCRFSLSSTPFWVDEFSTVREANLVLREGFSVFLQNTEFFEAHNITTHFLVAGSFKVFGIGEWQARLPFMIIGSIVPIFIYLLAKKLTNKNTALVSSLVYIFSYWQITWARQARGYVLQQLLVLITLYLYKSLLDKFSKFKLIILLFISIFGLLTHTTYILILGSLFLHFIFFNNKTFLKIILNPLSLITSILIVSMAFFTSQFEAITSNLKTLIIYHPNNLAYYHSFLWREQTIITLLAFIGVLIMLFKEKKYKISSLLLLPIGSYLFFVCFMFAPYVSRYLLPIFPLLIIFAGYSISKFGELISKKNALLFSLLITFFIIANGDKFVLKPKAFYSVNHDMREIALIDYDQVYGIIKEKGDLDKEETAVIDTWPDRLKWYLGENKEYFYAFRWLKSEGLVNGLPKSTNYKLNESNEKYIPLTGLPEIKLIGELSDLEMAMSKYPKGFIWIDDSSLPADVINYAKENFKEELYSDHYPLDDNPYSIWPGTLYSWGFKE